MQLRKLEIERKAYGSDKGQFVGYIRFDNELGEVALKLTPERCNQLFAIVADGVIDTAKEAAQELTCTVIDHNDKLLES